MGHTDYLKGFVIFTGVVLVGSGALFSTIVDWAVEDDSLTLTPTSIQIPLTERLGTLPMFTVFQNRVRKDELDCYTSTPIDLNLEAIGRENANRVTKLAELGNGRFTNFTVTPSGETLVVTTPTNAQVYSLSDTSTEMSFLGDCRPINHVAINADGSRIATSDRDTTSIQLWDTSSNSLVDTLETDQFWDSSSSLLVGTMETDVNRITSLAFDTTGTLLVWARSEARDDWIGNGSVFIHNPQTESEIVSFYNVADIVTSLHFSPGNEVIFRGSYPGYGFDIQIWDIETETRLTIRELWFVVPAYSPYTSVVALGVTMSLGITNEYSYQIEIWDTQTDTIIQSIPIARNAQRDPFAIPNRIPALALSSDAAIVAAGNDEGIITIWDVNTGTQLSSFEAYSQSVEQLAFTNDDKKLISLGSDDTDQSIRVWGIES